MKTCLGYPVIGAIETTCGGVVPVLDIKMMSDEEWRKYTEQGAIDNYKKHHEGHEPEGIQEAVAWQREWAKSLVEI